MRAVEQLRVVVAGYIVRGPLGGLSWHHLQYVVGLHLLGHDVLFVEDSDGYDSCYDPRTNSMSRDPGYGLIFAGNLFSRYGLGDRWAYFDAHTSSWHGPAGGSAEQRIRGADVILNISAVNPPRPWWESVPSRVLVDTDPVFTQIRNIEEPARSQAAQMHTAFLTFATNHGHPGTNIPNDGLPWLPTVQPVVLGLWPVTPGPRDGAWTTVMQWDSYAERSYGGRTYGMKSRSFTDFLDLPARCPDDRFVLAAGSPTVPRRLLAEHRWELVDPIATSADPWAYQEFIRASKGEVGVAKHGYVASRSGWFSERTANYLASGRPAVVQDTGWSEWLPAGIGVHRFATLAEAGAAIASVQENYHEECVAARDLAACHFDHRTVLPSLLATVTASVG